MSRNKVPCYGCQKRHPGCHGNCTDYKNYRQWLDEKNKRIRHGKEEERMARNKPVDHFNPTLGRKKVEND